MLGDAVHAPALADQLVASIPGEAGCDSSISRGGSLLEDASPSKSAPNRKMMINNLPTTQCCADKVKKD